MDDYITAILCNDDIIHNHVVNETTRILGRPEDRDIMDDEPWWELYSLVMQNIMITATLALIHKP